MNRNRLFAAALGIAALVAGAAFTAGPAKAPADKAAASHVHVVIFHLKKDAPADAAPTSSPAATRWRRSPPSGSSRSAGPPRGPVHAQGLRPRLRRGPYRPLRRRRRAEDVPRHPTHLKFVPTYEKYFETVQVFDFIDQKK